MESASSHRPALATLAIAIAVAVAACLPGAGQPSGTPAPSPSTPVTSPSPSGSPTPQPTPSFVRPTPTPRPTFLTYVVQRGDTLTSIARAFDTTARSIALWNAATYPSLDPSSDGYDPDRIEVGWTLVLIPGTEFEEDDLPSASPGPSTPPPTRSPRPATPPPSAPPGPSEVISNGPRGSGQVALTFDMGGRLDPALDILDWLIANDVPATIFPTGKTATETAIGRAVLERVRDHPELFALANHSWDHPNFTELTAAQMADQLRRTEEAVSAIVGRTTRPWFRPPYGAWNAAVRQGVGAAGWRYLVMWDVDTIDWRAPADGGPTADDIAAKVLSRAEGGSIVLMHLGGWNTLDALPAMLDGLRERGLEPVTLPDMLGL